MLNILRLETLPEILALKLSLAAHKSLYLPLMDCIYSLVMGAPEILRILNSQVYKYIASSCHYLSCRALTEYVVGKVPIMHPWCYGGFHSHLL